jgi:hypothetical protein
MKTNNKKLYWLPRIICVLAILFVSLFALDAFDSNLTIWQQLGTFAIHLIPSFILVIFLVIAWKWEMVGGIIFLVLGIALSPIIFMKNYNMNNSIGMSLVIILTITIPFIIVGGLFIANHIKKKK